MYDETLPVDIEVLQEMAARMAEVFWVCSPGLAQPLYVSPAFERIWGHSREALYARPSLWLESIHPEDRERLETRFCSDRCQGRFTEEYRIVRPDGSLRWVYDRAFATVGDDGRPRWVLGLVEDVTRRREAEEAIRTSRSQLRELVIRQQWDREVLRTRIAREIHDELGQSLTALNLNAYWVLHQLPASQRHIAAKVEEMIEIILATVQAVQRISNELRPLMLDELGLESAIRWYVEQFQARTGITCHLSLELENSEIDEDHATAVYRILQEAFTNIARHSDADAIELSTRVENGCLHLRLRDNGKGIDHNGIDMSHSFGLLGMQERAAALGGRLDIHSRRGEGTTLVLTLPLDLQEESNISTPPDLRSSSGEPDLKLS